MTPVHIVNTGSANLASVRAAIARAGFTTELTTSADDVRTAERLVLPGVGHFDAVTARLDELNLRESLAARLADPAAATLAICLGMQVMAESSGESPGARGLGVIPGTVTRFDDNAAGSHTLRVPQLGWNEVGPDAGCRLLRPGAASYANSYRLTNIAELQTAGWGVATTDHGGPFVAAIERGRTLACQFHPELSGPWGRGLIERWLAGDSAHDARAAGQSLPKPAVTPYPRVIPCLDVRDGRVVKGVRFQNLRDSGDPVERAAAYEAAGADELVILDVSATPEGRANAAETTAAVRAVLSIPLTVGGGVRAPEDAARLLSAGADKVGINTAAVKDPDLITRLADRFGVQCTVVAIDAARRPDSAGWEVVTTSGTNRTGLDAIEWCAEAERRGAGEILLTSWDRDGTRTGYDLDLLRAATAATRLPVIASGGVDTPAHMTEGLAAGATGVLAASIFHDHDWTVATLKDAMRDLGCELRAR